MIASTSVKEITPDLIEHAVHHAAHLLPAQGPITVFIHHNTLHALEHLSFDEGVQQGAKLFGGQPYLSEDRYRQEMAVGRILPSDVDIELWDSLRVDADVLIGFLGTRYTLRKAMLDHPLHAVLPNQLEWVIAESKAFEKFSEEAKPEEARRMIVDTKRWITGILHEGQINLNGLDRHAADLLTAAWQSLRSKFSISRIEQWSFSTWESFTLHLQWQICLREVSKFPRHNSSEAPIRHRDYLYWQTGCDSDELVNDFLVRFCIAMLDQGLGRWQIPDRNKGVFASFANLYSSKHLVCDPWLQPLAAELNRLATSGMTALESIRESLELLGVSAEETEPFITQTLLSLRGFAGMIWQLEIRGDRIAYGLPPHSLEEFLAIRLILDRLALAHVSKKELDSLRALKDLRSMSYHRDNEDPTESVRCEAFAIFQLSQSLGWQPQILANLTSANWRKLIEEVRIFDDVQRRQIFHMAYERRYRQHALDALTIHCRDERFNILRTASGVPEGELPAFDVVTCIDEREESFRRHVEEIDPKSRTWGTAGFFGVAMYYCAADSFQFVPLCPIVIEPKHYVQEVVIEDQAHIAQRRTTLRRLVGKAQHGLHASSRSLFSGALTALFGVLTSIPLIARVVFPRLAGLLRARLTEFHAVPSETKLHLERVGPNPGKEESQIGFSIDEMAAAVERSLRVIGLTDHWSRLVVVLGHGASTMNNPHESAYDCGACGGGRGGPNARAFAQMANDPRVRARMSAKGFHIPDTTVFVGGFHNTCNDTVTLLDFDKIPDTHQADLVAASEIINEASCRNAHERCRRFESADLSLHPRSAFRHVIGRSEDLSQVRPECGHATNAMCVVGRRQFTRGLFMDRRAFLHSYDPSQDDQDSSVLAAILGAIFPVCGGINLEYYFSHVDPEVYGCGTKLPHNIASLVGVMNGAASDLRPGLPWQMVEIHEPIRLLIVIESTPSALLSIMSRNPAIDCMIRGRWVQVATLDGNSGKLQYFQHGEFADYSPATDSLPASTSSIAWYSGKRDHLGFAQVIANTSPAKGGV